MMSRPLYADFPFYVGQSATAVVPIAEEGTSKFRNFTCAPSCESISITRGDLPVLQVDHGQVVPHRASGRRSLKKTTSLTKMLSLTSNPRTDGGA
eukprot:Skav224780  [mRNA]  locus=scaffold4598:85245:90385:- [translate_table: standard]